MVGGDQPNSGLRAGGTLGPVTIKGDVRGGIGDYSAAVVGTLGIKGITIGTTLAPKSVLGGGGAHSAVIAAPSGGITRVMITGGLTGGTGSQSAVVLAGGATGKIGPITIAR